MTLDKRVNYLAYNQRIREIEERIGELTLLVGEEAGGKQSVYVSYY